MTDASGTLVTWNSGVQRVLGYDEDQWLGQNTAMIFTPEDRANGEVEREMQTAERKGRALDERWHLRQNSERFFASGVLIALRQQLTALLLGLRALPKTEGCSSTDVQQIAQLQDIAEDLIDRAHHLAWQTRPAILDTIGLRVALEQGVKERSKQSGVAVDFIAHGLGSRRLSENLESTFYRVVLEALANVQRHAQAQSVSVSLERKGDTVSVIIENDGVVFLVETRRYSTHRALGLAGNARTHGARRWLARN